MEDERRLMMGVLDHLQEVSKQEGRNQDAIMEAIFAISNAYSLNMHNSATRERYALGSHSVIDVFKAGLKQLSGEEAKANGGASDSPRPSSDTMNVDRSSPAPSSPDPSSSDPSSSDPSSSDPSATDSGFTKFLRVLRENTAFFDGISEGSPEYDNRIKRAREKYDAKLASKKQKPLAQPGRSQASSAAAKTSAEALKAEGNVKLKAKEYNEALNLYTKAIELDGNNAVYYSNRAAANMLLNRYTEAIDDCKQAISIDKTFLRPRERLAAAYRHLGMTKNEVETLKDALKLAPDSDHVKRHLSEAEALLGGGSSASRAPGQSGPSGASPGLEALLNDMPSEPGALNDMARSMGINLPEGAVESFLGSGGFEQVGNMLRENPNIMQQAMQAMMGGGFPGTGDGPPNGGEGQG